MRTWWAAAFYLIARPPPSGAAEPAEQITVVAPSQGNVRESTSTLGPPPWMSQPAHGRLAGPAVTYTDVSTYDVVGRLFWMRIRYDF